MGVPKLFRFFTDNVEKLSTLISEDEPTPDFDNLYLDMNGIIHTCSHTDGSINISQPEKEVFEKICNYIEKLFNLIKPQQLLFLAIDGVAPRAKMNQQRSRRFRVANDSYEKEKKAKKNDEVVPEGDRFDSNCITPGTIFMERLNLELDLWIKRKRSVGGLWSSCKIILSGPGVPGEGEHKIMEYIRNSKTQPNYDPNTRHCMYGLDADLIMLGLCTHERNFTLLREEVLYDKKPTRSGNIEEINFVLVNLDKIKNYLDKEFCILKESNLKFEYNTGRIIDDWIFMVVLVGNDFIPNLPNVQIDKDAFPIIHDTYRTILPQLDGYITENGNLILDRFEKFIETLAPKELDLYFKKISTKKRFYKNNAYNEKRKKKREARKALAEKENESVTTEALAEGIDIVNEQVSIEAHVECTNAENEPVSIEALDECIDTLNIEKSTSDSEVSSRESAEFKEDPLPLPEVIKLDKVNEKKVRTKKERPQLTPEQRLEKFLEKKVKYYQDKLKFDKDQSSLKIKELVEEYVKAIQWILNYYYKGVCSWGWYYPYHYAPYIADITDVKDIKFDFKLGEPFKPFQQLLAVLPPASKALLPECYHNLMTEENLKEYYPTQIKVDNNGKKRWEALVILKFIDEVILLDAMQQFNSHLTDAELRRNTHGTMLIYS